MNYGTIEITAVALFATAVLHTFLVSRFEHLANKYPEGSVPQNIFHLLGEVEVVFGFWAAIFCLVYAFFTDLPTVVAYLEGKNPAAAVHYTEPAFVFVIMTMSATKPVLMLAETIIRSLARLLPLPAGVSFYLAALIIGPLLGSFITEPAAMTVTSLLLLDQYFQRGISSKLKYITLGVLFVNVSIGGTLTHFAAPPVLMVAGKWGWDTVFMLTHFGWKSALAVAINAAGATLLFYKELAGLKPADDIERQHPSQMKPPAWLIIIHVLFLFIVVKYSHHMVVFLGTFLFFLGLVDVTKEFQEPLKLKEGLLVGFFLAGLVTLGAYQHWWLQPLLSKMNDLTLYLGAIALTSVTDNAALTYLGSLVENLSDTAKYALVAGAVTGGGLTVIANAPNPAGFSILKESFGPEGISPLGLLAAAFPPTLVAMACLWFLPS